MRIDISIPDDWLPTLKGFADRKGVSLSRLLCESAFALLPQKEQKQLPAARKRGRPRKDAAAAEPAQSAKRQGKDKASRKKR